MIEVIKRNSQMTGRKSHCISIMIISEAQRAWIFTITMSWPSIFFYVHGRIEPIDPNDLELGAEDIACVLFVVLEEHEERVLELADLAFCKPLHFFPTPSGYPLVLS